MTSSLRSQSLRVTQVVHDFEGGGLETLVAEMVSRSVGTPVTSSVISLSGRAGHVGETIRPLADQFLVLRPLPGISMLAPLGLTRSIRRTRADVVHLHSGAWFKPAFAARVAGVPRVVYTEHGREHADRPFLQWLDRRAAHWTSVVVAVSDRLARYLEHDIGIDPDRIRTIPNGIDANRFSPGSALDSVRDALRLPPRARVIGSVGRLEQVKGYDRLLEAFGILRQSLTGGEPVYLVLCGDGSEREALKHRAEALGIGDAVRFVGWTDRAVDFYRLFDVFALTSHSEGASVSLLEAMASGAVPAVTDVGANAELLGPQLSDQVIRRWDSRVFAQLLHATLADPARRDILGALARKRVLHRYTLDGMLAAYERVYRGMP